MLNHKFYLFIGFTVLLNTHIVSAEPRVIEDSALKTNHSITENQMQAPLISDKENTWTTVKDNTKEAWHKTKKISNDVWEDVKISTHRQPVQPTELTDKTPSSVFHSQHKNLPAPILENHSSTTITPSKNNGIKSKKITGRNGGSNNPNNTTQKSSIWQAGNTGTACDLWHICPTANKNITPVLLENDINTHTEPIKHGKSVNGRFHHKKSLLKQAEQDFNSWANKYTQMKNKLSKETGISYTLDVSYMGQRGAPSGHITPWQSQYYGTATWDMFQSETFGSGSLNIAYELVRYWNGTGAELGNNIGIVTPLNDYTNKANYFYELSYTHQFPDKLDWLSVTLGQIPLYNFDGTTYNSNQQINFINEAFSQNATSTYPSASLGGYITVSPNDFWSFSFGGQDATNVLGDRISTRHFGDKFTTFVSGTINPKNKLGQAVLSLLLYNQPAVDAQPVRTKGWSVNAQQNIGNKLAVFMRANGVNKGLFGIKQSYVLGGVYNNPLNRNALDQIGFSGGINKMDKNVNGPNSRSVENILEAYWAWGIGSLMTITPDIQFYINPALNRKSNTATVATIRATMMF